MLEVLRTGRSVKQIQTEQYIRLLQQNNWSQSLVAELVGFNGSSVWRRMPALGLTSHTEQQHSSAAIKIIQSCITSRPD